MGSDGGADRHAQSIVCQVGRWHRCGGRVGCAPGKNISGDDQEIVASVGRKAIPSDDQSFFDDRQPTALVARWMTSTRLKMVVNGGFYVYIQADVSVGGDRIVLTHPWSP